MRIKKAGLNLTLQLMLALYFGSLSNALADKLPFPEPADSKGLPRSALIETTKGPLEIVFFRDEAPTSVKNFEYLAKKGYYDGVTFFRHEPGFMIQAGDPTGTGKGSPGYTLPPEISQRRHYRGALGWARLSDKVNPERRPHGSQFFIMLSNQPTLDGYNTLFAQVVYGIEILDKLEIGDKILSIRFPRESPR